MTKHKSKGAVRLLVVGAGRMGQTHLNAIATSERARVVGIVDPCVAALSGIQEREVALFVQLRHAIDAGGFDAALVATPSGLHRAMLDELMAAEIPTLCEKPCGLSVDDVLFAAQRSKEMGTPLQVGYWRRYVPELQIIREKILSGTLGDIALIQAWQWDGEPPAVEFRQGSGGVLIDMGVHEFDQLRWLTGQEIKLGSVVQSSVFIPPYVEADPESVQVTGNLSGGGVATVSLGRRYDRGDSCWAEVIGTKSSARCEFMMGSAGDRVFKTALVDQIDAFVGAIDGAPNPNSATATDAAAALSIAQYGNDLIATSFSTQYEPETL